MMKMVTEFNDPVRVYHKKVSDAGKVKVHETSEPRPPYRGFGKRPPKLMSSS
jgi:hypothetical protein